MPARITAILALLLALSGWGLYKQVAANRDLKAELFRVRSVAIDLNEKHRKELQEERRACRYLHSSLVVLLNDAEGFMEYSNREYGSRYDVADILGPAGAAALFYERRDPGFLSPDSKSVWLDAALEMERRAALLRADAAIGREEGR